MARACDDDGEDSSEEKIEIEKNYTYCQLKDVVNTLQIRMKKRISSDELFNRRYIYDFSDKKIEDNN